MTGATGILAAPKGAAGPLACPCFKSLPNGFSGVGDFCPKAFEGDGPRGFLDCAFRWPKGFSFEAKGLGFFVDCWAGAPNGLAVEVVIAPNGEGLCWAPLVLFEGCEDTPKAGVVPLGPKGLTAG